MYFSILAAVLIIALFVLGAGFFHLAFVRHKSDLAVTDLDAPINDFLKEHRPLIDSALDFVKRLPQRELTVNSFDRLKLSATYYDIGSEKTIFLFHGYRSAASRDFSCAIKMYTELGLNVLLIDQRSHGKSEGKIITFGVKERYDVLSWLEVYNKMTDRKNKIIISGLSMGAATVLLAAGLTLPQNVAGIIADCGFTSPTEIIKHIARRNFKINGSLIIAVMNLYCKLFGKFSIYGVSTVDSLKLNKLPVLFIHGKADTFVPYKMSEAAYNSASGEKRIILVDNAGHGMSFLTSPKEVKAEIRQFLADFL